tara:strand:+ start:381 stop:638 length:258 start_codon:yes stop_codon:yes gene_type:complete
MQQESEVSKEEASLFELKLYIRASGEAVLEYNHVPIDKLLETFDQVNYYDVETYENAHTIASIVKHFISTAEKLDKDMSDIIKST